MAAHECRDHVLTRYDKPEYTFHANRFASGMVHWSVDDWLCWRKPMARIATLPLDASGSEMPLLFDVVPWTTGNDIAFQACSNRVINGRSCTQKEKRHDASRKPTRNESRIRLSSQRAAKQHKIHTDATTITFPPVSFIS